MRASLAVGLLLIVSCSRREPASASASGSGSASASASASAPASASASAPASGSASAPASASASASGSASASPAKVEPKGTATLIVQRVQSVCSFGVGASGTTRSFLGNDVLLELRDGTSAKPTRDYVFCPKQSEDGGKATVTLNTWRMCRAYPTCKVVSADAGADRVELECGKDHVTLESVSGRTLLRGTFGEREVAPFPMTIAPVKREGRDAMVDC